MKPCLFCLGSNCTICPLHIYSYSSCIWKGTQTHLRHMPLLHQEALPRTESCVRTSLCISFSLPGIANRAEGAQPRNSPSFKQLGAFKISHVQENQDKTVPPSVTLHCLCRDFCPTALSTLFMAPQQALLPHAPHPGQSLLKFVGAWLSTTRGNSEEPNLYLQVYTLRSSLSLRSPQAMYSGLFPEGLVPTEGSQEHPTYVPVPPRMSLKSEGMLCEVRGTSCFHQSSFPQGKGTLSCCRGSTFLCLWYHQDSRLVICLEQVLRNPKKGSCLSCFSTFSTS